MKKFLFALLCVVMIASCLMFACGGGFGVDNDNAKDAAPGFFGPDSLRY